MAEQNITKKKDKFGVFLLAPDTVFLASFPTEAEAQEYVAELDDLVDRTDYVGIIPLTALFMVG